MINLTEDFKKLIEMDIEIENDEKKHLDLIKDRTEYFIKITRELNNYRTELRETYGLKDYNYADICKVEDADDVNYEDYEYYFKVVFNGQATAKMLSVIEDITGCSYSHNHNRIPKIYYFKLPKIVKYSTGWRWSDGTI